MAIQAPARAMDNRSLPDRSTAGLLKELDRIGRIVTASKWRRLIHNPFKYLPGIFFREFVYPISKRGRDASATLFWGDKINICLPASMDLYLLGCKTDDSELRLTRFIVRYLRKGDHFVDVGAHVGFYSLLSSLCVGEKGKVLSIEPSPKSFSMLNKNVSGKNNIEALNIAFSDKEEMISFLEFPAMYAEYNTMEVHQIENRSWFNKAKVEKTKVTALPGDWLLEKYLIQPRIIKIDVEGSENRVVKGLNNFLQEHDPFVAMEFGGKNRDNHNHVLADQELRELGCKVYGISANGKLEQIQGDVRTYVENKALESDNIIYKKLIIRQNNEQVYGKELPTQ